MIDLTKYVLVCMHAWVWGHMQVCVPPRFMKETAASDYYSQTPVWAIGREQPCEDGSDIPSTNSPSVIEVYITPQDKPPIGEAF